MSKLAQGAGASRMLLQGPSALMAACTALNFTRRARRRHSTFDRKRLSLSATPTALNSRPLTIHVVRCPATQG